MVLVRRLWIDPYGRPIKASVNSETPLGWIPQAAIWSDRGHETTWTFDDILATEKAAKTAAVERAEARLRGMGAIRV